MLTCIRLHCSRCIRLVTGCGGDWFALFFERQAHKEDGQQARGNKHGKGPAPTCVLGNEADDGVGEDKGAQEVAEEAGEAGGGTGCVLGGEVEGLDANEHHGTVDEEADAYQADDDYGEVIDKGPV